MEDESRSDPQIDKIVERILRLVKDVHITDGIIQDIAFSKISRQELKEIRKRISIKCYLEHLGYFSYRIKYIPKEYAESKKARLFFAC